MVEKYERIGPVAAEPDCRVHYRDPSVGSARGTPGVSHRVRRPFLQVLRKNEESLSTPKAPGSRGFHECR